MREVGRGGMGAVWLGRDEVLGRDVALKRVGAAPAGGEGADLARAEREARLAASLNHPHVVAVFDLTTEDDETWLVMEYVEGATLAEVIRRRGAMSPDEAAPLLRQAAEALASAHEAGIVHRDVKPSNIMVTPNGQVKLTDFGIARMEADATLTQTGMVTGSPAYLSPEVATGRPATDRSDVWALGATLFHALAGRPPYEVGDSLVGTLYRIAHEDPPRLTDAGWLAPLLEATMTPDPGDRWPMRRVARFLAAGPSDAGHGEETQVMTAPVPAAGAATSEASDASRDGAAATPASPASGTAADRRRRRTGPALLAALAVTAVAALVAVLLLGGDDEREPTRSEPSGEPTPSAEDPGETRSARPSPSPSPSEPRTTSPAERATAMEAFVLEYVGNVTVDPATTWRQLTPGFQEASGGFGQYTRWWNTIASADVREIEADPGAGTVTYTVDYTKTDGSGISDTVTLRLQPKGDGFLIADEY